MTRSKPDDDVPSVIIPLCYLSPAFDDDDAAAADAATDNEDDDATS